MATQAPPRGQTTAYATPQAIGGRLTHADISARSREHVPELRYPRNVDAYARMRHDDQIVALETAFFQPIHGWAAYLNPGGLTTEQSRRLADDLGLSVGAAPDSVGTRRYQVGWHQLLDYAFTACTIGHAVCEIVGALPGDPVYEQGWWRLHRLAPIEQDDIDPYGWVLERDGSLQQLRVTVAGELESEPLPAHRVQRWAWKPKQGDPTGTSMLRPLYRAWAEKADLLTDDVIRHNRSANGTWVGTVGENDGQDEQDKLLVLLSNVAVGEDTAIVLPYGQTARNVGIEGSVTDPVPSIAIRDQAMAKAWGVQVIQLGNAASGGSRALGDTFEHLADGAREAVAQMIAEELNRQIVARWLDWNRITVTDRPHVVIERPEPAETADEDPVPAVDLDDAELVAAARGRTIRPRPRHTAPAGHPPVVVAASRGHVEGVPQSTRDLTPQEIASGWNFAAIDTAWAAARDRLVALWRTIRARMIDRSAQAVANLDRLADRIDELAGVTSTAAQAVVTDQVVAQIAAVLSDVSTASAAQVTEAAAANGVVIDAGVGAFAERAARDVRATAANLASTTSQQVTERARNRAYPGVDPAQVADDVAADLATLTDANLERLSGAATTRAQAAGEDHELATAFDQGQIREAYWSSVLDGTTCSVCRAGDGRRYDTYEAMRRDFPVAGHPGCEGGDQCRCLPVVVWNTEQEVSVA